MAKNLIFDLGGVILDLDRDRTFNAFFSMGFSGSLKDILKLDSLYQTSQISTEDFCRAIASRCKHNISLENIANAWNHMCVNIPENKLQALKKLRKNHKVYLLSNTNELHWNFCCNNWMDRRGLQIKDCFDKLFLSYQMGIEKPNPKIFESVIKDLKISSSDALFLDDNADNINVAAKCGLQTMHVKPGSNWVEELLH